MDSENILNMAFLVEDYQTEYYKMDLQTQHSSEKSEPCMERECIKIQKELEISREFFESKKLEIPQLDSELCYLMKNYCAKNRRLYKYDKDLCKNVRVENACIRDIIYCLTKNIRLNDYPTSSMNHTI